MGAAVFFSLSERVLLGWVEGCWTGPARQSGHTGGRETRSFVNLSFLAFNSWVQTSFTCEVYEIHIPPASMSERVKITLFVKEIKMLKQVFFYFRWVFTPSMLNMREHIAKNHLKTISSLEILFSLYFWINEEQVNFNVEIFRHTGLIKNWPSSSKKHCY